MASLSHYILSCICPAQIYINLSHHRIFPSGIWLCNAGNPHSRSLLHTLACHFAAQNSCFFRAHSARPTKAIFSHPFAVSPPLHLASIVISTTHFVYIHLCPARSGHSIYTVFLPVCSVHHSHVRYSVCHVSKLLCFAVSILLTLEGRVENTPPRQIRSPISLADNIWSLSPWIFPVTGKAIASTGGTFAGQRSALMERSHGGGRLTVHTRHGALRDADL
jgi:hypothetical protein